MEGKKQWSIFINSVFFVLGFSLVFSVVGVLLQSVLSAYAFKVQKVLGWIGGAIIIFFGIFLLGLVKIPFLEREHKLQVKRKFRYSYITSFVFGAAFAVGWTPCVGAILGAILTLAVSNPGSAFPLMLSYSLGLGIPFLVVGLFTDRASGWISRYTDKLKIVNYIFGALLVLIGVLVFTNNLSRVANFSAVSSLLVSLDAGISASGSTVGLGISFIAGIASFLSPCVLPLIPAFLSYLAATA